MDATEAAALAQVWIGQWTELQKRLRLARVTAAPERGIEDDLDDDDPDDDLADGALEILEVGYAVQFIDRVEQAAAHDEKFREALSSVWGWSAISTDILDRIAEAVGRPGA